jgi:hypothetical protein
LVLPSFPSPDGEQRRIEELERKIVQQLDLDFLCLALRHVRAQRWKTGTWQDEIYAVIHAQTQRQDNEIERMCRWVEVSRAGYYRHWQASAPRQEETALRDAIQRLSLSERHYGYSRVTTLLRA